jgi:4-amino-4-deoxy-L-arabinose transferase-like glycosyltransferase
MSVRSSADRGTVRLLLIFTLALISYGVIVSIFPFDYHDSDSSCYSRISQELAYEPLSTWCAPQWYGHGGNQGLFRDHPPGLFWLPALLVRAGVKASRAALCANFIYILLGLYFLFKLAALYGDAALGWAAVFGFVLTPIFMQYLVRANHEQPLNLAVVAGLYGLARSSRAFRYKALFAAALVFAVFIKGLSAIILSILAFLFWLILSRNRKTFTLIVVAHLLMLATVALFEGWYRSVTHSSFLAVYIAFQGGRTVQAVFAPLRKLYNLMWYGGRALWFSAPWVYFALYGLFKYGKKKLALAKDTLIQFLFGGSAAVMAFISLSDRKADRYIFPAYLLLSFAGVYALSRMKPGFLDFFRRRAKRLPWILALGLVVFSFLSIFIDNHFYKFIRFWPN